MEGGKGFLSRVFSGESEGALPWPQNGGRLRVGTVGYEWEEGEGAKGGSAVRPQTPGEWCSWAELGQMEEDLHEREPMPMGAAQTRGGEHLRGTPSLGDIMSRTAEGWSRLHLSSMPSWHPHHYAARSQSSSLGVSEHCGCVNCYSVSKLSLHWCTGA